MSESQTENEQAAEQPEAGHYRVSAEDAKLVNKLMARQPQPLFPNMDAMNGMLNAFVCSPTWVKPARIMEAIVNPPGGQTLMYKSAKEADKFMDAMQRQLIDLHYALSDRSRLSIPHIECETRPLNHWARGFAIGAPMTDEGWKRLIDDKEWGYKLFKIYAYAGEPEVDFGEIIGNPGLLDRARAEVIEEMPYIVQMAYDYFAEDRKRHGETYPKYYSKWVHRSYTLDKKEGKKLKRLLKERNEARGQSGDKPQRRPW